MTTYLNCKKTIGWILSFLQYIREGEKQIPINNDDCTVKLFQMMKVNLPYSLGEFHLSISHTSLTSPEITDNIHCHAVINEESEYVYTDVSIYASLKLNKYIYEILITDKLGYVINLLFSDTLKSIYFETIYSRVYNCKQLYDSLLQNKEDLDKVNLLKNEIIKIEKDEDYKNVKLIQNFIKEMNEFVISCIAGNDFKTNIFRHFHKDNFRLIYPA